MCCTRSVLRLSMLCSSMCAAPSISAGKTHDGVTSHIWVSRDVEGVLIDLRSAEQFCREHTWRSHVTHFDESCYAYIAMCIVTRMYRCSTCPTWCISMSHVTHVDEACYIRILISVYCPTYVSMRDMSHMMHMNESCHTCGWVMSMSHITHTYQCVSVSCRTYMSKHLVTRDAYQWVMSHM